MDDQISRQAGRMDISDDIKNAYYDGYDNGYNAGFEAGQRDVLLEKTQLSRENTTSDPISRQTLKDAFVETTLLEWEQLKKYYPMLKVVDEVPSAQPEPQWIPCSERLPEDGEKHYWVCTDTGYQCECRWTNINHFWTDLTTNWHWHIMDIPQYSHVVAWRELPEPWKEGEA